MDNKYSARQEFVDNPSKRIPVCIVVDSSGSMYKDDGTGLQRIDRVNKGIRLFLDEVKKDPKTRNSIDISIISVGNEARIIQPFVNADKCLKYCFYLKESGDLVKGAKKAIEILDDRKNVYNKNSIDYYQPWLIIMSDGVPTRFIDGISHSESDKYARRDLADYQNSVIKKREESGKLVVFPVCITGSDRENRSVKNGLRCMSNFTNDSRRLITLEENSQTFDNLFAFLHKSASSVARGKGFIKDNEFADYNNKSVVSLSSNALIDKPIYSNDSDTDESENKNRLILDTIYEDSIKRANELKNESNEFVSIKEEKTKFNSSKVLIYVNGRIRTIPKNKISDSVTTYSIYLNKDDCLEIYKDSNRLSINDFNKYICKDEGRYLVTINNDLVIIYPQTIKLDTKNIDKKYDDEIKKILNDPEDWDTI